MIEDYSDGVALLLGTVLWLIIIVVIVMEFRNK